MEFIDQLTDAQRQRAWSLHRDSIVINALDSTRIAQGDEAYIAKLKRSGVTATNHTVSATEGLADTMKAIVDCWHVYQQFPKDIIIGRNFGDIERAKREGKVAVFLGFQDTNPIEGHLYMLEVYSALGIRFVQLTYQRRNLVGDGCGERTDAGLSIFGLQVVKELNRLGIVIDLSHVGVRSTLDAIEHSEDPVTVTHSGVRALMDTPRNKTDEEIKALAARGGVIGIPPKSGFLKPNGLSEGTSIEDYIAHIDYVADLVGIDHVGIGTDVGDERKYTRERMMAFHNQFPEVAIIDENLRTELMHTSGLQSPATLFNITAGLVNRGYSDDDIRKVLGGNFLRVFRQVMLKRVVP
jgi:microsomal dipeptidase-like Zn-dependent dipeptidase